MRLSSLVTVAATTALMAGCGSAPTTSRHLRDVALITSGDVVAYSAPGTTNIGVTVVDVDGKPVNEPYAPIELKPGSHTVTVKCDDINKTLTRTFAAGEVYQLNRGTLPGVKG